MARIDLKPKELKSQVQTQEKTNPQRNFDRCFESLMWHRNVERAHKTNADPTEDQLVKKF